MRSTYWYVAHSCCLILIYVTYAIFANNPYLFIWAGLCVREHLDPPVPGGRAAVHRQADPGGAPAVPRRHDVDLRVRRAGRGRRRRRAARASAWSSRAAPSTTSTRTVSLNLLAGAAALRLRHHRAADPPPPLQAGARPAGHDRRAPTSRSSRWRPSFFTMVEIEILTKVMGTVFAMLYAARLLAERFRLRATLRRAGGVRTGSQPRPTPTGGRYDHEPSLLLPLDPVHPAPGGAVRGLRGDRRDRAPDRVPGRAPCRRSSSACVAGLAAA